MNSDLDLDREQALAPLRLDFQSKQQVLVIAEDEDRFLTTSEEAASACKQRELSNEFQEEFNQFLAQIHKWCNDHGTNVSAGYLSISSEGLKVFIVTTGNAYKFDFDDEITHLDVALADNHPLCMATVYQIPSTPKDALASFFSLDRSIQLHGQ